MAPPPPRHHMPCPRIRLPTLCVRLAAGPQKLLVPQHLCPAYLALLRKAASTCEGPVFLAASHLSHRLTQVAAADTAPSQPSRTVFYLPPLDIHPSPPPYILPTTSTPTTCCPPTPPRISSRTAPCPSTSTRHQPPLPAATAMLECRPAPTRSTPVLTIERTRGCGRCCLITTSRFQSSSPTYM